MAPGAANIRPETAALKKVFHGSLRACLQAYTIFAIFGFRLVRVA
jgi:hypothetical protein